MLTVRQLREALAQLGKGYDDFVVETWLPGSYIELEAALIPDVGRNLVLIEGNLKPGSALEQ